MRFINYLMEMQNDNLLYHGTTLHTALKILQSGKIKPNVSNYISLSRNPNLWFGTKIKGEGFVTFVLNKKELRHRFKIKPIDYFNTDEFTNYNSETVKQHRYKDQSESEERVYTKTPINISYIIEIRLSDDINKYAKFYNSEGLDIDKRIKDIVDLAKSHNIPINTVKKPKKFYFNPYNHRKNLIDYEDKYFDSETNYDIRIFKKLNMIWGYAESKNDILEFEGKYGTKLQLKHHPYSYINDIIDKAQEKKSDEYESVNLTNNINKYSWALLQIKKYKIMK